METKNRGKFLINAIYFIVIALLVFVTFKYLLRFLLPFIIAIIIGLLVQKPAIKISKKLRISSQVAATVLAVLIYLIIGAVLSVVLYYLVINLQPLVKTFSEWATNAANTISSFFNKYIDYTRNLPEQIGSMLENLPNALANSAITFLSGTVSNGVSFLASNIPSFLFTFIITVMASVYFSHDFQVVKKFIFSLIGEREQKNLRKIKKIMSADVFKMLKGYALLSLITFAELSVGFLFFGIKSALLLAAIIAVIDALPVLGVGIVLLPWGIISIISGNVGLGIFLSILYLVITVVRNILEPKILSGKLGIPPLLSLLIIFFGLKLFGFFGMLAAFITLVIIIDFYREEA